MSNDLPSSGGLRPIPWPGKPGVIAANGDSWVPYPWSLETAGQLFKDLIGRKLRVSSGPVSMEIDPGRVTILVDDKGVIRDMYVDPDRPTI